MRESNYRSIANNRAAVTITTSLYDRRALDVTSDKPLVNSLNHLTYLVSSSAKVRETLANDGGIERLVTILHECQSRKFASLDALYISEQKLLTAWKWTLAFQCIVLIGTRGTEKIRQKVVCAGMLPVIATIFDNYQCLREPAFTATHGMPPSAIFPFAQLLYYESTVSPDISRATAHSVARTASPVATPNHLQSPHLLQNNAGPRLAQPNFFDAQATNDNNPHSDTFMNIRLPHNHPPIQGNIPSPANHMNTDNAITSPIPASDNEAIDVMNENALLANRNALGLGDLGTNGVPAQNPLIQQTTPNPNPSLYMMTMNGHLRTNSPLSGERTLNTNTIHIGNLTSEDYDNLTIPQLLKLVKADGNSTTLFNSSHGMDNSIRKGYLIVILLNKLRESKENELCMSYLAGENQLEMDTNLNFLTDLYLQDERSIHTSNTINTKIAPRSFTDTGIIIPRDDDVVWCLQLLAYVSKYPYLKDILQNTHLIPNMSIREKQLRMLTSEKIQSPTQRRSQQRPVSERETLIPRLRIGRFFTPSTLNVSPSNDVNTFIDGCDPSQDHSLDDLNIRNETFGLAGNTIEQYEKVNNDEPRSHDSDDDLDDFDEDSDHKTKDDEEEVDEYLSQFDDNVTLSGQDSSYLTNIYDRIIDAESIGNDLDRKLALNHLKMKISNLARTESHKLSNTIIEKRLEQRSTYSKIWNYDNYLHFDIDEDTMEGCTDVDESLLQYKKVNLFPMVEQFTFFGGTDMYYWSGVIMRNSCRRNDFKGGVRQCGNLECGKWEKYPREFSKCKRCKRTKYCSRECQTRAWACHKNWCVPSNSSNSTTTNDSVLTQAEGNTERAGNVTTAGSDVDGVSFNGGESPLVHPSDQDSQPMDL